MMDSLIPAPGLLTYNGGTLFVVERSTPKVVALDARTGAYLWQAGRMGAGPEEFSGIAATFPDRDGGIAVVDVRNRRITRISSTGAVTSSMSTGTLGRQPNQACRFGGEHLLLADVFQPQLIESDSTGNAAVQWEPLWPDLSGSAWESRQVILRGDDQGRRCLAALATGRGFAILTPGADPLWVPYIEPFEPYGIGTRAAEGEMSHWATYQAAIAGDTISMLFSGMTADKERLVDRYSAVSGEYIESLRLPDRTSRFAAGDDLVFILDTTNTRILALRPRR